MILSASEGIGVAVCLGCSASCSGRGVRNESGAQNLQASCRRMISPHSSFARPLFLQVEVIVYVPAQNARAPPVTSVCRTTSTPRSTSPARTSTFPSPPFCSTRGLTSTRPTRCVCPPLRRSDPASRASPLACSAAATPSLDLERPCEPASPRGVPPTHSVVFISERGVRSSRLSQEGWTALHLTALKGHRDVAGLLLARGGNIESLTTVRQFPTRRLSVPTRAPSAAPLHPCRPAGGGGDRDRRAPAERMPAPLLCPSCRGLSPPLPLEPSP